MFWQKNEKFPQNIANFSQNSMFGIVQNSLERVYALTNHGIKETKFYNASEVFSAEEFFPS